MRVFLTTCLLELLPFDPNTIRYANERTKRFERSIHRRKMFASQCSANVGSDIVAQNRGLGMHDSTPRQLFSDAGMMTGRQLVESNTSLKTCTLFPFQKESLILAPEHMENFYKVISKEHLEKKKRKYVDISGRTSSTASAIICNSC